MNTNSQHEDLRPLSLSGEVEKLRDLNAVLNEGRGIQTLRYILGYLDAGDAESARAVWGNDGDKLTQHPKAHVLVVNILGCRNHFVFGCKAKNCAAIRKFALEAANR